MRQEIRTFANFWSSDASTAFFTRLMIACSTWAPSAMSSTGGPRLELDA